MRSQSTFLQISCWSAQCSQMTSTGSSTRTSQSTFSDYLYTNSISIQHYHHSLSFGRFFLNLYFVHFSASGRSSSSLTTFCSSSPNLSVPEIVTFSFFTSCKLFTLWQMWTQHPVLESLMIGLSESSSGMTLQIGLPSPSNISHLYLALWPLLNMEAWVRMDIQPMGNRLCSEWQFGRAQILPVATRVKEGLMTMGNLILPSLSLQSQNLGLFLVDSSNVLYFFLVFCIFYFTVLNTSQYHSMRANTLASLALTGLQPIKPCLLTCCSSCSSFLPAMQAGWSGSSPGLLSSTSSKKSFRLSGSIEIIDFRMNSRMLIFLMNLLACSQPILKGPFRFRSIVFSSFILSSERIYWQFHLMRDTIFSTCAGVLLKSLICDFTLSFSSCQFDLLSAPTGTPKSIKIPNKTFFSASLHAFSSSSLEAYQSKSISPWFCWIFTIVLISFFSLLVRLSATGKS